MNEHKKFQEHKLLEEIIKDALEEQQVRLTVSHPIQYELQGNYEEVMTKAMEFIIVYRSIEIKFEVVS